MARKTITTVSLPRDFLDELDCQICMERRPLYVLPQCQHRYCHGCIQEITGNNGQLTCPSCRMVILVPTNGFPLCRLTESLKEQLLIRQQSVEGTTDKSKFASKMHSLMMG